MQVSCSFHAYAGQHLPCDPARVLVLANEVTSAPPRDPDKAHPLAIRVCGLMFAGVYFRATFSPCFKM